MLAVSLALNGIVLGSVLLLFSLGLTLIYGVGRIVNFAHGALFSIGAMLGVWLAAPCRLSGIGIICTCRPPNS